MKGYVFAVVCLTLGMGAAILLIGIAMLRAAGW